MSDEVRKRECQKCGACCRHTVIDTISALDLLREPRLRDAVDPIEAGFFLMKMPCPFLNGNRCSIYPTRPNICVAHVPGTNECCPQYDPEYAEHFLSNQAIEKEASL